MKTIGNLLSLAVFMVGACKAVYVVGGTVWLKSEGGALKFEVRVMDADKSTPAKNVQDLQVEKPRPLPPHWVIVTPVPTGKNSS